MKCERKLESFVDFCDKNSSFVEKQILKFGKLKD